MWERERQKDRLRDRERDEDNWERTCKTSMRWRERVSVSTAIHYRQKEIQIPFLLLPPSGGKG